MFRKSLVGAVLLVIGAVGCGGPAAGGGRQQGPPPGEFDTPEQLLNAAQPAWRPAGPTENLNGVSFQYPTEWELLISDDGVSVTSPVDEDGDQCKIFVLEPRPAASTEAGRLEQALQVASKLLVEEGRTLTDDFGSPTPLDRAFRGSSGRGWDYAGLTMRLDDPDSDVGTFDVISMIAHSGTSAVPIVAIQPLWSAWGCVGFNGEFGLDVANVFHSLDMGNPQPDHSLESKMEGKWFSSSGSAGNLYIFGANKQYIHASATGGLVEIAPDQWANRYATWLGDGSWAAVGDVLGMFPNDGPASSHFARHFEFRNYDGDWQESLCLINAYDGEPYTYCTERSED